VTVRRVAVTGVGICTPLGVGTDETWDALLRGDSAVGDIQDYEPAGLHTRLGAEIRELNPKEYVEKRRSLRTMTRHDVMTIVPAVLAVRDSGLEFEDDEQGRAAAFSASGKETSNPEGFTDVAIDARDAQGNVEMGRFGELAFGGIPPLFFLEGLQGSSLHYLSEAFSLRGANTYFAGTAEAGMHAIGRGYRAVRRGEADVAIAGAGDAPVNWWNMGKIDALGVLSRSNELGPGACRPFDRDRDGTVMGEGGAFLVLEDLEAAQGRGANIHAEVVGYGSAVDLAHYVTPDASGGPVAQAVTAALREVDGGGASPDYVAAHGSGTRQGDASEAAALRSAIGEGGAAASSVKPATGHLGAAAGALNAAVAALAVARGAVPPTLNLENVDPDCEGMDWVAKEGRETDVNLAVALARGLEGQAVALALRGV
jgi:3-oxoacyl-[acyl-carrier-protein] synthase II